MINAIQKGKIKPGKEIEVLLIPEEALCDFLFILVLFSFKCEN